MSDDECIVAMNALEKAEDTINSVIFGGAKYRQTLALKDISLRLKKIDTLNDKIAKAPRVSPDSPMAAEIKAMSDERTTLLTELRNSLKTNEMRDAIGSMGGQQAKDFAENVGLIASGDIGNEIKNIHNAAQQLMTKGDIPELKWIGNTKVEIGKNLWEQVYKPIREALEVLEKGSEAEKREASKLLNQYYTSTEPNSPLERFMQITNDTNFQHYVASLGEEEEEYSKLRELIANKMGGRGIGDAGQIVEKIRKAGKLDEIEEGFKKSGVWDVVGRKVSINRADGLLTPGKTEQIDEWEKILKLDPIEQREILTLEDNEFYKLADRKPTTLNDKIVFNKKIKEFEETRKIANELINYTKTTNITPTVKDAVLRELHDISNNPTRSSLERISEKKMEIDELVKLAETKETSTRIATDALEIVKTLPEEVQETSDVRRIRETLAKAADGTITIGKNQMDATIKTLEEISKTAETEKITERGINALLEGMRKTYNSIPDDKAFASMKARAGQILTSSNNAKTIEHAYDFATQMSQVEKEVDDLKTSMNTASELLMATDDIEQTAEILRYRNVLASATDGSTTLGETQLKTMSNRIKEILTENEKISISARALLDEIHNSGLETKLQNVVGDLNAVENAPSKSKEWILEKAKTAIQTEHDKIQKANGIDMNKLPTKTRLELGDQIAANDINQKTIEKALRQQKLYEEQNLEAITNENALQKYKDLSKIDPEVAVKVFEDKLADTIPKAIDKMKTNKLKTYLMTSRTDRKYMKYVIERKLPKNEKEMAEYVKSMEGILRNVDENVIQHIGAIFKGYDDIPMSAQNEIYKGAMGAIDKNLGKIGTGVMLAFFIKLYPMSLYSLFEPTQQWSVFGSTSTEAKENNDPEEILKYFFGEEVGSVRWFQHAADPYIAFFDMISFLIGEEATMQIPYFGQYYEIFKYGNRRFIESSVGPMLESMGYLKRIDGEYIPIWDKEERIQGWIKEPWKLLQNNADIRNKYAEQIWGDIKKPVNALGQELSAAEAMALYCYKFRNRTDLKQLIHEDLYDESTMLAVKAFGEAAERKYPSRDSGESEGTQKYTLTEMNALGLTCEMRQCTEEDIKRNVERYGWIAYIDPTTGKAMWAQSRGEIPTGATILTGERTGLTEMSVTGISGGGGQTTSELTKREQQVVEQVKQTKQPTKEYMATLDKRGGIVAAKEDGVKLEDMYGTDKDKTKGMIKQYVRTMKDGEKLDINDINTMLDTDFYTAKSAIREAYMICEE